MLKYTEGYLTIKGIKIHYYRTGGKKPPFILLHGATDNGLCWTTIAELLSKKYDVIMPDAQGHGLSDRLGTGITYENHLHQTVALVEELGLKRPLIMGHSMGAGTAVNVAVEYPSLPGAIILEDPPWTDEERLYWARAKQQFDPSLFSTMVLNPNSYDELAPKIKCPTLLIIAENGVVSRETAENIARLWKSRQPFKWVQIMGATHNIRRDNFPAYRDSLFGFLKDLTA